MFQTRENVVAGGLMSYGASFSELFRNGAAYALKILQGAKPEDLPVLQPVALRAGDQSEDRQGDRADRSPRRSCCAAMK